VIGLLPVEISTFAEANLGQSFADSDPHLVLCTVTCKRHGGGLCLTKAVAVRRAIGNGSTLTGGTVTEGGSPWVF
jgi:hypothetical protein